MSAWSWSLLLVGLAGAATAAPVGLIIDTDIGGGGCNDVDDVVALSIANALSDNHEAELLAVVLDTAPVRCAGAISVLNHFYQRDDVPIGAYNVSTKNASLQMQSPLDYVNILVSQFPSRIQDSSQAEDAVQLYRRVLSSRPDRSVTIASIGIHTNLAALLRSPADAHSFLDGRSLVAQKVSLLAVMGGKYPSGLECNLEGGKSNLHNHLVAAQSSAYVAAHWPPESKIMWSGFEVGVRVLTGGFEFQRCVPAAELNPVRAAMVNFTGGPNRARFSWDPLTTLAAVRGAGAVGCTECSDCDGHNYVDPTTGANKWITGRKMNQTYLVLRDATAASMAINALLCQSPKAGRTPQLSPVQLA